MPDPPAPEKPEPQETVPPQPPAEDAAADSAGGRRWDRILSYGLLVLAAFNVITGIPPMLDLAGTLQSTYTAAGLGAYTSDSLASSIGVAINITQVLLLLAAVALTLANLRRGRISFWIPLSAGVVATLVMMVLLAFAIFGDPGFAAYVDQQMQDAATTAP
ncbi:hypothetical protein L3i23_23340 [Herbiconiux sp. L3-i23]|nr:hypothetical protein L3i23_23340 [Herbiconiux sp. L3-i23]